MSTLGQIRLSRTPTATEWESIKGSLRRVIASVESHENEIRAQEREDRASPVGFIVNPFVPDKYPTSEEWSRVTSDLRAALRAMTDQKCLPIEVRDLALEHQVNFLTTRADNTYQKIHEKLKKGNLDSINTSLVAIDLCKFAQALAVATLPGGSVAYASGMAVVGITNELSLHAHKLKKGVEYSALASMAVKDFVLNFLGGETGKIVGARLASRYFSIPGIGGPLPAELAPKIAKICANHLASSGTHIAYATLKNTQSMLLRDCSLRQVAHRLADDLYNELRYDKIFQGLVLEAVKARG